MAEAPVIAPFVLMAVMLISMEAFRQRLSKLMGRAVARMRIRPMSIGAPS